MALGSVQTQTHFNKLKWQDNPRIREAIAEVEREIQRGDGTRTRVQELLARFK